MKVLVFGAISALALLAVAPANAATGYVGAAYTRAEVDAGAGDNDADAFGVEGAVAFDATESLGLDLDAAYSDSDDSDSVAGATAHLYGRAAGYKFGGFVGLADTDETIYSVGVEGQRAFGQFTLAGALAYANADDSDVDAYGVDVEGRFFATDNFRLSGKLGYASLEGAAGDDDLLSAGVGAEYQFASLPISVVGGYTRREFDEADVSSDAFTVGVRYNWGGSLKDRDENGPSFAGLSSLTAALGL
ncbi:MAG: porin [Hyphomonadaceae bacterium]|nr:porin [Hyphomonadaceae bacterium]